MFNRYIYLHHQRLKLSNHYIVIIIIIIEVLSLKGLRNIIDVSVVHPTWQKTKESADDKHYGWAFVNDNDHVFKSPSGYGSFPMEGSTNDKVNNFKYIRDIYEMNDFFGPKFTVSRSSQ